MNVEILWQNVLNEIKDELSSLAFDTWFSDVKLVELDNGVATIEVPMSIHKKHLSDNYFDLIRLALNKVTGTNFDLEFLLPDELNTKREEKEKEEKNVKEEGVPKSFKNKSNLNPKYNFENFIVGNSNKFAQAAALSVAENPGKMYNPLFIYGNSGLGKTHLMHAIGNYIVDNSNRKVLYVTSDQFRDDFVGINKKGATQTQQEFFHTFTNLYNDSKQIIISSDRSPNDLKLLEERLRTRFCWGLTVNIYPPDFELRKEILRKKIIAGNFEAEIPEDVIEYIASNMGSDVRQLEGSITRLVAYSTIMGGARIDINLAIEALKDFISKGLNEKNDITRIQKIVAEYFQISVEDIRSKKRSSNIAFPRQIAMYLCRKLTSESFPKIGTEFGGKDHSTVMHSVEKIEQEIKNNSDLAGIIKKLEDDLKP